MKCGAIIILIFAAGPALAQQGWQKIDTVTSGSYDDHSPQVDHGGLTGGYFNYTLEWVIFERGSGSGSSIAGIRHWSNGERWDSSATIVSPASPEMEQQSPDVCSFLRSEGSRYVSTVLAAWQKKINGIWNIWYSISDSEGADWSEPLALTSDSLSNTNVKIRPVADSGLIVFWRKADAVLYSIFDGENLTKPETLVVSNFDSVDYDLSKNNRFVWTIFDSSWQKICLATGEITSVLPASVLLGDTIRCGGDIYDAAAMYHWYNSFFTFECRDYGMSASYSAELYPWSGPWMIRSIGTDYDASIVHSSFFNIPYGSAGFWVWEKQTAQDTSLVFTLPDTVSPIDIVETFAGGHNPSMGSLFLIASIPGKEVNYSYNIAVWESGSDGNSHIFGRSFLVSIIDLGVKPGNVTLGFNLSQNYPNPFNPSTTISYQLPAVSHVMLKIYDVLGREVATLVDETKLPGTYQVRFDGSRFASGVYFYRLEAGTYSNTKKLLLLK